MVSQITPDPPDPCRFQEISLSNRREAICALIEACKNRHMTLLEFAWVSGVSWDAVRSWEKGRREPAMGLLVAAAETLGFEIILRPQDQTSPVEAKQPPITKRESRRKHPNPNQFSFFFLDHL